MTSFTLIVPVYGNKFAYRFNETGLKGIESGKDLIP